MYHPNISLNQHISFFDAISISLKYITSHGFTSLLLLTDRIQGQYRMTSRETQRIESVTRTPIFSHFAETLGGVVSIRALKASDQYIRTNGK